MAKIVRLSELEARKRALVAESEVYRQTLTLEIQNLRLYSARMQRRLSLIRMANPLLISAGSLLASRFFGKRRDRVRRGRWQRLIGAGLMGWRLFRQFRPLIETALRGRSLRSGPEESLYAEPRSEI